MSLTQDCLDSVWVDDLPALETSNSTFTAHYSICNNKAPETMLTVDDYAVHCRTGLAGRVVGHGHQVINDAYLLTLKVLVTESTELGSRHSVREDLLTKWMPMK
jgi:hypothetical protein